MSTTSGELDVLISSLPHARFITCPVFGAPPAAAKRLLIAVMSGDYRSKKEVAHLLVPAAAQKVIDVGGDVEKGLGTYFLLRHLLIIYNSSKVQTFRELFGRRDYGGYGRILDPCREGWYRARRLLDSSERSAVPSPPQLHVSDTHSILDLFPAPMYAFMRGDNYPANRV